MSKYPFIKLVVPTALKAYKNGQLPGNLLAKVKTGGQMYAPVAEQFNKMYDAALAAGFKLKNVGDYRSFEGQLNMFMDRYVTTDTGTGVTRQYEGKTWYLKKGMAMLATPGKSQHNLGLAVDVHSASEPKRLNWLIANVKEFGFSWEVVPSEPWHLRYVNGDNVPASVKAWMEANGVTAPAAGAPVTAAGARGEHTALQEALKAKGFYKGNVDGVMSPALQEAVKAFKVANKLAADSVVGPKVKELLGLK
jgi:hypothetical protein